MGIGPVPGHVCTSPAEVSGSGGRKGSSCWVAVKEFRTNYHNMHLHLNMSLIRNSMIYHRFYSKYEGFLPYKGLLIWSPPTDALLCRRLGRKGFQKRFPQGFLGCCSGTSFKLP